MSPPLLSVFMPQLLELGHQLEAVEPTELADPVVSFEQELGLRLRIPS